MKRVKPADRGTHPIQRHLRRQRGDLDAPAAEQPVELGAIQERAEIAGQTRRGALDHLM